MLSDSEMLQLCRYLEFSEKAQRVIGEIRASPPVRRVRSGVGNVCVRYPSRKMGFIIQAESHKIELAGIYEMEHDPKTLEYYDQPAQIKLKYQAKSGRQVAVLHTPDFFVIRTAEVGWEEWKTEEKLLELAETAPNRYVKDEARGWRCPPGESYAQQFGFFYRLRSSAEIDWIFQRNIRFLEDYLRDDCPPAGEAAIRQIVELVNNEPGVLLSELVKQTTGQFTTDDIYTLIASGQVYVNWHAAPLSEPEQVRVFSKREMAQAYAITGEASMLAGVSRPRIVQVAPGQGLVWDGKPWQLVNLGERLTTLLGEDKVLVELPNDTFTTLVKEGRITGIVNPGDGLNGKVLELLLRASEADLQKANRRYQVVQAILNGQPPEDEASDRTHRRWVAQYRQAEQRYGCGYVGLLSQLWRSGNRNPKLPTRTQEMMNDFIKNRYEHQKQLSIRQVYGQLVEVCQEAGVVEPSYKTLAKTVNQQPRYEQTERREGRRQAYPYEPIYLELSLTVPRHGDRPFEINHIDHTQLDVELICSLTRRNLGRPWATFLSDAFSRRLLVVYLTFDPPSYRTCMMVLRECVRRQGRLPQVVVVDGGREFQSTYFETLLARYECTKKTRPGAKPRFGSTCERLFGTTNSQFVQKLIGSTKAPHARKQAIWNLGPLYKRLCEWAYEVYDTLEHPALNQSPREAFALGLAQGGRRPHRLIGFDEEFQMFTLPTTPKGTALVQPNRGVSINSIYYWSDAFRDPEVERSQVPIRYDPFDAGTAYAMVRGKWVSCVSEYYARFRGRSERELMLATAELRRRKLNYDRSLTITARQLAQFLDSLEAEEILLEQRLRDAEGKQVLGMMQGNKLQLPALASENPTRPDKPENTGQDSENLPVYGDF